MCVCVCVPHALIWHTDPDMSSMLLEIQLRLGLDVSSSLRARSEAMCPRHPKTRHGAVISAEWQRICMRIHAAHVSRTFSAFLNYTEKVAQDRTVRNKPVHLLIAVLAMRLILGMSLHESFWHRIVLPKKRVRKRTHHLFDDAHDAHAIRKHLAMTQRPL